MLTEVFRKLTKPSSGQKRNNRNARFSDLQRNNLVGLQHDLFSCFSVLMTVLFGSYATANSRAPPHAHEDTEESLNRLFEYEAANVEDHIGDKMVSDNLLLALFHQQ